jgi:hypothetical protein
MINGRRQPSCGGTSRMMREYQVRICERLEAKFPGSTRPTRTLANAAPCPLPAKADIAAIDPNESVGHAIASQLYSSPPLTPCSLGLLPASIGREVTSRASTRTTVNSGPKSSRYCTSWCRAP